MRAMKTVTEFPRKVVEFPDMGIVMPDGCRLSARIWMPEDAADNPVPAIMEHLPYRKRDGTIFRDQLTHPYFAGHGYASIRVDMRGNGDSEGLMDDEYTEQELQDACDVIAWAASQPWCNGNVGMMGISWGGFNCLQVAAKQPPALKAVISLCSTVDRYADDIHYKGGCLLLENVGWASTMLSYSSRPPDPAISGEKRWRELWLQRLENQPFLAEVWLGHQHRDAYWKRGSICEDFSAVKAAVLSIGGWHDGYRNTISHLVSNIQSPVKGIVGPWIHKYPHYAGPKPAIGFLQEALRWWDHWLKGVETGVEADPAYRAYVMDSVRPSRWHPKRPGRWVAEQQWPSANIKVEAIELIPQGASPAIVATPQTCGLTGGEYFPFTFGPELPGDQRPDDALSVCFDQPELTGAIDIVGAPEVEIRVASDRRQANIAVRLCDVHPDGASELISYGVLNLTHRNSHEFPEALVPGETVSARVVLDQCAYRVPADSPLLGKTVAEAESRLGEHRVFFHRIRRAGADAILTYWATEAAAWLAEASVSRCSAPGSPTKARMSIRPGATTLPAQLMMSVPSGTPAAPMPRRASRMVPSAIRTSPGPSSPREGSISRALASRMGRRSFSMIAWPRAKAAMSSPRKRGPSL